MLSCPPQGGANREWASRKIWGVPGSAGHHPTLILAPLWIFLSSSLKMPPIKGPFTFPATFSLFSALKESSKSCWNLREFYGWHLDFYDRFFPRLKLGLKRADPAPLGSQGKVILQNTGFFSPMFWIKFISKLGGWPNPSWVLSGLHWMLPFQFPRLGIGYEGGIPSWEGPGTEKLWLGGSRAAWSNLVGLVLY